MQVRRRFTKIDSVVFESCKNGEYELIEGNMILIGSKLHKQLRKDKSITFDAYKREVWKVTHGQNLSALKNYSERGFNNYHVDHKISIHFGFNNKISTEDIGHISNLRMIESKENLLKRINNFIDPHNKWILDKYSIENINFNQ